MHKRLLVGLLVLMTVSLSASSIKAGPDGCTNDGTLTPFADEQLVVSTTAVPLTATVYAVAGQPPADMAVIWISAAAVRYRDNGLAPTTAIGRVGTAASSLMACGTLSIRRVQFIRDDAADATLEIGYYRRGDQ